jgi:GTPase involved in cell partitioning and DNA repair
MEAREVTLFSRQATTLITLSHSITLRGHVLKTAFPGLGKNKTGKSGAPVVIKVPCGTTVWRFLDPSAPNRKTLSKRCPFFDPITIRRKSMTSG